MPPGRMARADRYNGKNGETIQVDPPADPDEMDVHGPHIRVEDSIHQNGRGDHPMGSRDCVVSERSIVEDEKGECPAFDKNASCRLRAEGHRAGCPTFNRAVAW